MISIPASQLAEVLNVAAPAGLENEMVTGVSTDTRTLAHGDVFVALPGERVDGASLAAAALEAGASCVITQNEEVALESGADPRRLLVVPDALHAIGALAKNNLQLCRAAREDLLVVGITGSVGKTTTKDLLASLLKKRGAVIAPPGSFNNELGLPLTVLRAEASTSSLVLEMGADHIGNLEYLTSIASPDIACVLIVARAHVGEFGGIDNIAKAKAELLEGTRPNGISVLNAADERVRAMAAFAPGPVWYFLRESQAANSGDLISELADSPACAGIVRAHSESSDDAGHASFVLEFCGEEHPVHLGLVGEHHVSNALAAASIALAAGLSLEDVAQGLSGQKAASPHRMDVRRSEDFLIIDDSYNANPDSMRAGIAALGQLASSQRKVAVLGEMLELGEVSRAEHTALAEPLARAGVSILVALGEGMKPLAEVARDEGIFALEAEDVPSALESLEILLQPGDAILVKGSHGSGAWKVANYLITALADEG